MGSGAGEGGNQTTGTTPAVHWRWRGVVGATAERGAAVTYMASHLAQASVCLWRIFVSGANGLDEISARIKGVRVS